MIVLRLWNRFWFGAIPSGPLGLFRIVFAFLVIFYALLLFPDRWTWFGTHGTLPLSDAQVYNEMDTHRSRPELLTHDYLVTPWFIGLITAAVFMMFGVSTRLATLIVLIGLTGLHNRNPSILNSGDLAMFVMGMYLFLAPAGEACSLHRLKRILDGREGDRAPKIWPWAQRLIQIQVSLVYVVTTFWKMHGSFWRDGTAIYYPLSMPEMARFPMFPLDIHHLLFIKALTYFSLFAEFSMAYLVWIPRFRLFALLCGTLLHIGIEYSLNIPLFSALMIASYIAFLRSDDLDRFTAWIVRILPDFNLRLVYDGECEFCRSALLIIHFLDAFHAIETIDYHDTEAMARVPMVSIADAENAAIAVDNWRCQQVGFYAFRAIAWRLPALWPIAWIMNVPGIPFLGRRAYAWIAANRSRLPVAKRFKNVSPQPAMYK